MTRRLLPILFIPLFIIGCSNSETPSANEPLLYLPDDLEATLWAESPMFYNPTNMDVDAAGRIWITEAVNYRNFNNDSTRSLHHPLGDRVVILEDTDGDGKADRSKVFVEDKDLVSPLGIAVVGDKVIVSCSPNLIVYTDSDGDDKPDSKEIFLTGFGGLDHDHSLHAVVVGPDGKWYFNTGNAGPHVVNDKAGWTLRSGSIYTGGSPYNTRNQGNMKSDDGKIWVGGLALRVNPDGSGLKVMGHNFRNSYESIIDSYGNLWQNDNDDQVVACRTSWLMEGGNAGYFSTDGTRYWQADQRPGQDVFTAHWHQDDPGIMPAGDMSGAGAPTGITINEGDGLGEKYRGLLLSADAGRNVIFGYLPKVQRSGYDLGQRTNFVTSLREDNAGYVWNDTSQNSNKDKWFRPSDVTIGTDGAMYIADWYDPVVGGHQMQDSIGYGRIYRITPKGRTLQLPRLDMKTTDGLLEAFKNPAIHVRSVAFALLKSRGEEVIPSVRELLNDRNEYIRARAVWLLSQLGSKGLEVTQELLDHNDPLIRASALRALRQETADILPVAEKLSHDSSSFVRREVAVAVRDLPFEKTQGILTTLAAQFDERDKWYLEALASAWQGHEDEMYPILKKLYNPEGSAPEKWNEKFAALMWRLHPARSVSDFRQRASSVSVSAAERSRALTALAFIPSADAVKAMIALSESPLEDVAGQAGYWVAFRQSNDWYSLIDWSKTGIDTEHQRKVAAMKVRMSKILEEQLPFDEKKWNARDMAKDAVGGQMLIGMAAEKKLPQELFPVVAEFIFGNPDQAVRIQASDYFKKPGSGLTYSVDAIKKLQQNIDAGHQVFVKNCATCHRVKKEGMDIGPELTQIQKKFDRDGLLDAVINPNAGIVFGYEPWLITTKSGESFYGFLVSDGEKAIVMKDIAGKKHVIDVAAISARKKQENSLMPEPSSLGLTEQNLADVTEYLMTLK